MILDFGDFLELDTGLLDNVDVLLSFEDRLIEGDKHSDSVIKQVSGDQVSILENSWSVLSQRFITSLTLHNPSTTDTITVSLTLVSGPNSWPVGTYELEPLKYQHVPVSQLSTMQI